MITVEYSLGSYVRTNFVDDAPAKPGVARAAIVEEFAEGTRCDETGKGRRSIVGYVCSTGETVVQTVAETATCVYRIVIATRHACVKPVSKGSPPSSASTSSPAPAPVASKSTAPVAAADGRSATVPDAPMSITEILSLMKGTCFYRADGWWTYEICPSSHVAQTHQDANVPPLCAIAEAAHLIRGRCHRMHPSHWARSMSASPMLSRPPGRGRRPPSSSRSLTTGRLGKRGSLSDAV